ncbi:MAG: VWA domain-containing protein [Bdellovibrionaceae bacterium]|nr:VWA domain-containing protein [Pseudobdellovibrionaceae bacterium]
MQKIKWLLAGLLLTQSGCKFIEDTGTLETPEVKPPPSFEVTSDSSAASSGTMNPDDPKNITSSNPGTVTPVLPAIGPDGWREDAGFQINSGATATNSRELLFDFDDYNKLRMKISTNETCEGGNWEDFSSQKNIFSERINQVLTYSVRFLDYEHSETTCFKSQIVHDTEGPSILFAKYPNQTQDPSATSEMTINISDRLTAVKSATCQLIMAQETLEKPCASGNNSIVISSLPEGQYSFVVHAEDILGNKSSGEVKWSVASTTRQMSQSIQVNDYKKVDILFVIDNSGSMGFEQKNMASRVANFLSVIRGLDYQVAVTTTDPRSSVVWGDGQLLPFSQSAGSILDIRTPEATAQDLIGKTLQRPETGSGTEQAIFATYRVIDRYINNQATHRQLFREGAQFAVINISDEDESANGPKNDPENLIKHVHDTFGGQKTFSFHSIITKPGDTQCKSTYGATYGARYKVLSDLTGGIVGSVCEQDYAAQVTGIAQGVRDLLKTISLQCQPITSGFSITIKKDGQAFTDTFRVDGVNLIFDTELSPGNYVVDYRCLR